MTPNPPTHRWKMSDQNPDVVELPYKTAKSKTTMGTPGSPGAAASGPYSLATGSLGMDKSTLKVHLPDGSFNVVRFGDATDIKVSCKHKYFQPKKKSLQSASNVIFAPRSTPLQCRERRQYNEGKHSVWKYGATSKNDIYFLVVSEHSVGERF